VYRLDIHVNHPRTTQSTGYIYVDNGFSCGRPQVGQRSRRGANFFSEYDHRDSMVLCGPYDVDKRGTKRPPKNFGRPRSCQEVVLHVSHLVMLLGSSGQDGVRQLTRQGPFLAFGLRRWAQERQSLVRFYVRVIARGSRWWRAAHRPRRRLRHAIAPVVVREVLRAIFRGCG
jgi:hypothetical protein